MVKAKASATKKEPIYTWAFKSSKPRAGGEIINYVTRLNEDGSLSCNCPGWIFAKSGHERGCKHTRDPRVAGEYKTVFKMWKNGEALPTIEWSTPVDGATLVVNPSTPTQKDISKVGKYGRVLELD